MNTLDIVLLGGLCCLIAVGFLFRQHRAVRLLVIAILFCISFGSIMTLSTFGGRLAVAQHERTDGQASKEFVEGVVSVVKIDGMYFPYVLLSTVGLGLLAITSQKRP
jgi:hypothetical protein